MTNDKIFQIDQYSKQDSRLVELKRYIHKHIKYEFIELIPMPGDAGSRDYYRVNLNEDNFILMDCHEDVVTLNNFTYISSYLEKNGFRVPKIYVKDIDNGYLLIEDFDDLRVGNYLQEIKGDKSARQKTYHLMIDSLIKLHNTEPLKTNKVFSDQLFIDELEVFYSYYIPSIIGRELNLEEISELKDLWSGILAKKVDLGQVTVLRDYHVDNAMLLDKEFTINSLGLLDFQDGLIGCPTYDIVSLLEDAREDVSREEALEYLRYYSEKTGINYDDIMINYHIVGAQRNSRILGVFVRKFIRDGKDNYLKYLPRVEKYLKKGLSDEILMCYSKWCNKIGILK